MPLSRVVCGFDPRRDYKIYWQVAVESYTFYTCSGILKTWVRTPPCQQNINAKVAQLVELLPSKQVVASSNLVFRSRMLMKAVYATTTFAKVNTHSAGVVQRLSIGHFQCSDEGSIPFSCTNIWGHMYQG